MSQPVNSSPLIPPSPSPEAGAMEVSKFLSDLVVSLKTELSDHARVINDDLLVMSDFIRLKDAAYTALVSDRVILVFATANRIITLPDPDLEPTLEPHPITVMHTGAGFTVTIDPLGSVTIDGAATKVLAAGESATMVPVRQRLVDQEGVGSIGWHTIGTNA